MKASDLLAAFLPFIEIGAAAVGGVCGLVLSVFATFGLNIALGAALERIPVPFWLTGYALSAAAGASVGLWLAHGLRRHLQRMDTAQS